MTTALMLTLVTMFVLSIIVIISIVQDWFVDLIIFVLMIGTAFLVAGAVFMGLYKLFLFILGG